MRLGVNIDHIATIREARKAREPEPVSAAVIAELAGAEGITVHLRSDRRHIKDRDVEVLRQMIARSSTSRWPRRLKWSTSRAASGRGR